jgi:glycosyltransferase involved in cell wall biosynthesis
MKSNVENLQSQKISAVAVLMPTFNGGLHLGEQLQSISNQAGVRVNLYVNDDVSTDRTLEIVEEQLR